MAQSSNIVKLVKSGGSAILDVLYPRRCLACQRWMPSGEPGFLCAECYQSIEFITNPCQRCGNEAGPYPKEPANCPACRKAKLHFTSARAPGAYSTPLKELVHALKYARERAAVPALAEILLEALKGSPPAEFAQVVVPVPLHRLRLRERTFNQSALIAKVIARKLELPFAHALVRTRATPSQTELSTTARRENVKGAFAVRRPRAVKGRQVLLVDDVLTTGATASECAKALIEAGAARVYVGAVAR